MKKLVLILTTVTIFFSAAIYIKQKASSTEISSTNTIVTSFYPLYYFTNEIGKGIFEIENITPSGAEPHDYEPTTQDIRTITNAKLVIVNGGGLENWSSKIDQKNILTISTGIAQVNDSTEVLDPHIWLDPVLAQQIVEKISSALTNISPSNGRLFEERTHVLIKRLQQLDQSYSQTLSQCGIRTVITSHKSISYLARRYNFQEVSISGLSPDEEPSAKKLTDIAHLVKKENVNTIFFEELVSPRLAQTIADETGATTQVFNPLEGLTASQNTSGEDYFSIQQENLLNLGRAMKCM